MDFVYDDGGRQAAGYKGSTGDCVVRSIYAARAAQNNELERLLLIAMGMEMQS